MKEIFHQKRIVTCPRDFLCLEGSRHGSILPTCAKCCSPCGYFVYLMHAHYAFFINCPAKVPERFAAVCNVHVSDGQGEPHERHCQKCGLVSGQ